MKHSRSERGLLSFPLSVPCHRRKTLHLSKLAICEGEGGEGEGESAIDSRRGFSASRRSAFVARGTRALKATC